MVWSGSGWRSWAPSVSMCFISPEPSWWTQTSSCAYWTCLRGRLQRWRTHGIWRPSIPEATHTHWGIWHMPTSSGLSTDQRCLGIWRQCWWIAKGASPSGQKMNTVTLAMHIHCDNQVIQVSTGFAPVQWRFVWALRARSWSTGPTWGRSHPNPLQGLGQHGNHGPSIPAAAGLSCGARPQYYQAGEANQMAENKVED